MKSPLDPHAGVIFRLSWRGTWARLSDAEVGILTRSLLAHAAGEDVDADALPGRLLPGLYAAHATEIDLDLAAYADKVQRRREAGRKGGRPRKAEAEAPEEAPEAGAEAQEEAPEPEEKPVPAPVPAKAPRRPVMSEAEQKALFDRFWQAAGDASQSPAGAWSWWRKAIHSEARAEALTIAAERAQALQDARGLARYNIIGWLRKQGWKAEACTDEGVFRAELARASSGRRAVPAGSTENALAALLGAEPEPVDVQAIEEGRHAD